MLPLNDRSFQLLTILFLLFAAGLFFYPGSAGLFLILSLFVFGGLSILWKENHLKVAGLVFLVLLALVNVGLYGFKFGIDFSGGTRIPILLEHSVDQDVMNELIQSIKKRISVLGLTEAKVRAIGNSQIDVEVPSSDPDQIRFIQDTLSHQGVFQGIIEGQLALSGEDIFTASITPLTGAQLGTSADWGVQFSINQRGAQRFADAAEGQANKPIYMFLDRPRHAAIFIDRESIRQNAPVESTERRLVEELNHSLQLEGDPIRLYVLDDINVSDLPSVQNTTALIRSEAAADTKAILIQKGYTLREVESLAPIYQSTSSGVSLDQWEAVGLLTTAILSPGVTQGLPIYNPSITGSVGYIQDPTLRAQTAEENIKRIESILKGGSLPVQISLGSSSVVPPSLGEEFLHLSLIGIVAALITISIFIGLRYHHLHIILPIIGISISELIILLSILGSFTIDLAAMAGIIAAIGVSVDAQIVITDELLKKQGQIQENLKQAFSIIKTTVIVAIVAMLPLLFSGLVEVIGFATATILGALLGFLLSRPAYGVLAEKILK